MAAQLRLLTSLCLSDMPVVEAGVFAAAAFEMDEQVDAPGRRATMKDNMSFLPYLRVLKVHERGLYAHAYV